LVSRDNICKNTPALILQHVSKNESGRTSAGNGDDCRLCQLSVKLPLDKQLPVANDLSFLPSKASFHVAQTSRIHGAGCCHCYQRSTIASDGCFRSKSADPNDQQGVCVDPRPTAKHVRITPHSHCGNTRSNRKARKLSRSHRPWLSAKSHVQKDGGPTSSPHLQHIRRYPRNWRNCARIFTARVRLSSLRSNFPKEIVVFILPQMTKN